MVIEGAINHLSPNGNSIRHLQQETQYFDIQRTVHRDIFLQ
jgi:hypothetical protein